MRGKYDKMMRHVLAAFFVFFIMIILAGKKGSLGFFLPLFSYYENTQSGGMTLFPLYEYQLSQGNVETGGYIISGSDAEIIFAQTPENESEGSRDEDLQVSASGLTAQDAALIDAKTMDELIAEENRRAQTFVPAEQVHSYDWTALQDYKAFLSTFYTIDSGALDGTDLFSLDLLRNKDFQIVKDASVPQILIYHTHSRENYKGSAVGDKSGGVVAAGEELARILREDYGYQVIHHVEEYDTTRDDAYGESLPAIEKLLQENPGIQVVIDLHRDSGNPNREMVVDLNGKKTAKFMFFNGISRSRKTGNIDYLYNPNLTDNLGFSFQMQALAGEYYPGITRKIYIKQYRYNMHLRPRTLLIELGDENNTLEEAKNACYPIAHLLDMVLSGQKP